MSGTLGGLPGDPFTLGTGALLLFTLELLGALAVGPLLLLTTEPLLPLEALPLEGGRVLPLLAALLSLELPGLPLEGDRVFTGLLLALLPVLTLAFTLEPLPFTVGPLLLP